MSSAGAAIFSIREDLCLDYYNTIVMWTPERMIRSDPVIPKTITSHSRHRVPALHTLAVRRMQLGIYGTGGIYISSSIRFHARDPAVRIISRYSPQQSPYTCRNLMQLARLFIDPGKYSHISDSRYQGKKELNHHYGRRNRSS